jgi:hypothetical protein
MPIRLLTSLLLISFGHVAYANGHCTDIAARFTLHESATLMNLDGTVVTDSSNNPVTVASAIVGDGNDVYSSDGTIKICSTFDAILNLQTGKRKITAILPTPIPNSGGNSDTPPPGHYTDLGVINVRNIVCNGCLAGQAGQPFVTKAGAQLNSMYNGSQYGFHFLPIANVSTLPFAPDFDNDGNLANTPNVTSLVLVLPQPYNCAQGVYPSWIVRGTLENQGSQPSYLALATLVDAGKNSVNAGQFSMPFEYQIQALSCFTPY